MSTANPGPRATAPSSAATICPNCGNQISVSASFCTRCGALVESLRSNVDPVRPKGAKVRAWTVIVILVIIEVVILATVRLYFASPVQLPLSPPPFAPLEVQYSGPPCPGWSNGSVFPGIGITGGPVTMSLGLSVKGSSGSCTAESVLIRTSGFTLISSNAPVTVGAGASGTLTVIVRTPSTMPAGNVTLVVNVGAVTAASLSP